MTITDLIHEHPFLTFCVVFVLCQALITLVSRTLRSVNIAFRGWPPAHLDADGNPIEYEDEPTKPSVEVSVNDVVLKN